MENYQQAKNVLTLLWFFWIHFQETQSILQYTDGSLGVGMHLAVGGDGGTTTVW